MDGFLFFLSREFVFVILLYSSQRVLPYINNDNQLQRLQNLQGSKPGYVTVASLYYGNVRERLSFYHPPSLAWNAELGAVNSFRSIKERCSGVKSISARGDILTKLCG